VSDVANPLSAASLLLAVLALLYSAWSTSIQAALDKVFATSEKARNEEKAEIRRLRNRRAAPIALGSWLIAVAFVPRDFDIAANSAGCIGATGCHYDDVAALFLLTQLFVVAMAVHLTSQVFALSKKVR